MLEPREPTAVTPDAGVARRDCKGARLRGGSPKVNVDENEHLFVRELGVICEGSASRSRAFDIHAFGVFVTSRGRLSRASRWLAGIAVQSTNGSSSVP
eukprot:4569858-Prymnesium_polylepis.1